MSESSGGLPPASVDAPALPAVPALEITAGATPSPAPAPEPSPTPVDPPAPAADPAPAPTPEPAPAAPAPDAPAPDKPAEPSAPEAPKPAADQEPSALSTQKPDDAKPGDAPADAPAADAPVGYEFVMPEGVVIPKPELEPFVETLREHGITPQAGQKLLDMYVDRVQQLQVDTLANQWKAFSETRKSELERVKSDPELGGAGYETTRSAAARGRDLLLGSNPEHVAEYERMLANTGVGEQLALWRLFVTADRMFREPTAPAVPSTPPQNARGNGPRRGMAALFKNPSGR